MMDKRGFEFSFGWMFALIVGAAILALAIYAASNFIDTSSKVEGSARSVEISSMLRQLQTGVEEKGASIIDAGTDTRITNDCFTTGSTASEKSFGMQSIKTATSSKIGKTYKDNGIPLKNSGIYLFSNKTITSDKFTVLSQPFKFPYKVADVAIMFPASDRYCFVNAPIDVQERTAGLDIPLLNMTDSISKCPAESKKVCFSSTSCDIVVSTQNNAVSKGKESVRYDDENSALFYAAIFSSKDVYECQVKRLMNRGIVLAEIYSEKATLGSTYGCPAESLVSALDTLSAALNGTTTSMSIAQAKQSADIVGVANDALACKQF